MEAKTNLVEWKKVNESLFTLSCPICGKVWEEDGEDAGNPCWPTPCKHLKFRLIEGFDVEWFGEGGHRDIDMVEFYNSEEIKGIDTIFSSECNYCSTSILYGVKK